MRRWYGMMMMMMLSPTRLSQFLWIGTLVTIWAVLTVLVSLMLIAEAEAAHAQYGQADLERYLQVMDAPVPLDGLSALPPIPENAPPSGAINMSEILLTPSPAIQSGQEGTVTTSPASIDGRQPTPPVQQNDNNYVILREDMFENLLNLATLQTMGSTYQPGTFVDGNLVLAGLATIGAVALVILARGQFFGGGKL